MKTDHSESIKILRRDKRLAPLIHKHGLPDLSRGSASSSGVFQALLRSIIHQQVSGNAARAIHARVLALFPKNKPTPEALLKIRAPKLRAAGLSVQKIAYVRDLARRCIDGTIDPKRFKKMTSEEVIEHLIVVNGIGRWSAQMLLIFTLGHRDILPVGDLGIQKGFQVVYGLRALPTKKQMEKFALSWRGHESIASWYLWRAADAAKSKK
jgi:3-methyladenine DNA glycosylase/8-oxoguanine DNA glycosylase